jgi:hypothetical protein
MFWLMWSRSIREQDTQHNPPTQTHMRIDISNNRRQQFALPVILTPDDDHIGRNM